MIKYSLGFLFSEDRKKVVLIRKTKPDWQAGFMNGVGGKVEWGETYKCAMVREFEEETGVMFTDWKSGCFMDGNGVYEAEVFYAFGDVTQCKTIEEEEVVICDVSDLQSLHVIENLKWMIPMFIDDTLIKPLTTRFN